MFKMSIYRWQFYQFTHLLNTYRLHHFCYRIFGMLWCDQGKHYNALPRKWLTNITKSILIYLFFIEFSDSYISFSVFHYIDYNSCIWGRNYLAGIFEERWFRKLFWRQTTKDNSWIGEQKGVPRIMACVASWSKKNFI